MSHLIDAVATRDNTVYVEGPWVVEVSLDARHKEQILRWLQQTVGFLKTHLNQPAESSLLMYREAGKSVLRLTFTNRFLSVDTFREITLIFYVAEQFNVEKGYFDSHYHRRDKPIISIDVIDSIDALHLIRLILRYLEMDAERILSSGRNIEAHEINKPLVELNRESIQSYALRCPSCEEIIHTVKDKEDIRNALVFPYRHEGINLYAALPLHQQLNVEHFAFWNSLSCGGCKAKLIILQLVLSQHFQDIFLENENCTAYEKYFVSKHIENPAIRCVEPEHFRLKHPLIDGEWVYSTFYTDYGYIHEHTFGPFVVLVAEKDIPEEASKLAKALIPVIWADLVAQA